MKAPLLPPGGTIGVAGTSSPWEQRSEVDRAVRWWESKGYRVRLGSGVFDRDAYLAGDAKTRARDLVAMFEGPDVDAVQSLGGGFGATESGRVTAPLVGGCLWLLRETLATPWEVELDGSILFFEDGWSPPYQVDGTLLHLANAGKLDGVVGVVVGEMAHCEEKLFPEPWLQGRSMEDVFEARLQPLGVPVVFNLPLGHGKHLATIPLGATVTVDADARTLVIEESALEPADPSRQGV